MNSKTWRRRRNQKQDLISQFESASKSGQPMPFKMRHDIGQYVLQKLKLMERKLTSISQTNSKSNTITATRNSTRNVSKTKTNIFNTHEVVSTASREDQNELASDLIETLAHLGDSASIFVRQQMLVTALQSIKQSHLHNDTNGKKNSNASEFDENGRANKYSFTANSEICAAQITDQDLLAKYPLVDIHGQMQDVKNVVEKHHRRSKMYMRHVAPICDTKQFDSSTFTYNVTNKKAKELQSVYETLYKCDQYDSIDIFKFDLLTDGWSMSLLLPIMFEQYHFFDSDNLGTHYFDISNDLQSDELTTLALDQPSEQAAVGNKKRLPLFVDRHALLAFLEKIQINYFDVPYHNRIHASDVLQTAFFWLSRKDSAIMKLLTKEDIFAILIACAIHDLQHPGTSQMFLLQAEHPITKIYNDSDVLEHMHLSQAFLMMKSDENLNIFKHLTNQQTSMLKRDIIDCVLATNFAHQSQLKTEIKSFIPYSESYKQQLKMTTRHENILAAKNRMLKKLASPTGTSDFQKSIATTDDNSTISQKATNVVTEFLRRNTLLHRAKRNLSNSKTKSATKGGPKGGPKPLIWKNVNKRLRALSSFFQPAFNDASYKFGSSSRSNKKNTEADSAVTDAPSTTLVNIVDDIELQPIHIDFLDNNNGELSRTVLSANGTMSFHQYGDSQSPTESKMRKLQDQSHSGETEKTVRSLLKRSIVHAADISHCAKPLLTHQEWSERYYQETYVEKHILKTMKLVQQVDMKRKDFPKEQVWFIANLILPFYELFCQFIDSKECDKILSFVETNLNFWKYDPTAANAHEITNQQYAGVVTNRQRSRRFSRTVSMNQLLGAQSIG